MITVIVTFVSLLSVDINANGKSYVLVPTRLTWKDAQAHCRRFHTDLAVVENAEENEDVQSLITSFVWIGLYREPWTWSDKSSSTFKNWNLNKPDNFYGTEHCVAEYPGHGWDDVDCSVNRAFFCHEDPNLKMMKMRMKIQTDADMADPAINTQILQQIDAVLTNQGRTDVKLQWVIQPRKQKEEKDEI
ncbi:C-type lectin BpLec-like [Siniperca chuatsi]|uniref:C-type lectin BpLec-like n=1 Tax=Siniperca chuatsi TaxID=119488 RepID=UPI001CE17F12|nr:C-type lectin BpLec-like [Siniperca chuatsi]